MHVNDLIFLFNKHLHRSPFPEEIELHGGKIYKEFEKEILNCEERKDVLKIIEFSDLKTRYGRIAVLLTGHIRKNSILAGIRKFIGRYDYDIFIHTWDNLGIKGDEVNLKDKVDKTSIGHYIERIPNVKKYLIENNKDFIDTLEEKTFYFNYSSPEPFIKSQLYSIQKSYELLDEYIKETGTEYKLVIRMRFDSKIEEFTLEEELIRDINENNILFVSNKDNKHDHPDGTSCIICDNMYYNHHLKKVHIFEHSNVICDLFAYGSLASMRKYCYLYENYDKLNESFFEKNVEMAKIQHENIIYENNQYSLCKTHEGHLDSLYYFYCSYPERLIQVFLKKYMLIESKLIKLTLVR